METDNGVGFFALLAALGVFAEWIGSFVDRCGRVYVYIQFKLKHNFQSGDKQPIAVFNLPVVTYPALVVMDLRTRLKQRNERLNRDFDVTRQEQPFSRNFLLVKLFDCTFHSKRTIKLICPIHRTAIVSAVCCRDTT